MGTPLRRAGPFALYGISLGAFVGALCWVGLRAPEVVASHFGVDGTADAWSSRGQFTTVMGITGGLILVLLPAAASLVKWVPAHTVNVPNREYWLAPENRPELAARFRGDMLVIASLTALLLAAVMVAVVLASQVDGPIPGWLTPVLIGYIVTLAGYVAWMFLGRYRVPAQDL